MNFYQLSRRAAKLGFDLCTPGPGALAIDPETNKLPRYYLTKIGYAVTSESMRFRDLASVSRVLEHIEENRDRLESFPR